MHYGTKTKRFLTGQYTSAEKLTQFNIYISDWVKENLPDSENYWISDVDQLIRDRWGNVIQIEYKCRMQDVPPWQRWTLHQNSGTYLLGTSYAQYRTNGVTTGFVISEATSPERVHLIRYHRPALIQFEGEGWDSQAFWNRKPISTSKAIKRLSFEGYRKYVKYSDLCKYTKQRLKLRLKEMNDFKREYGQPLLLPKFLQNVA